MDLSGCATAALSESEKHLIVLWDCDAFRLWDIFELELVSAAELRECFKIYVFLWKVEHQTSLFDFIRQGD